jgi:sarcosine oxidase subunit alpha
MGDVTLRVNGVPTCVREGTMVAAALLNARVPCRVSVDGEPRTALCGMGICMECRATVDGVSHQRTCQIVCREGMDVETRG